MCKVLPILAILVSVCFSAQLPPGPDPIEFVENETKTENKVTKRQIPWYLPVIQVPQVVQVHHIVYLQAPPAPDTRCYPSRPIQPSFPQYPLPSGQTPGQPTLDDGLTNRMGGGNTNTAANQPSRCVWAIVACCSPGSLNIRYTCFELLGCQGAFWDENPCNARVTMAAANTALRFYMGNTTKSTDYDDVSSNLAQ